MNLRPRDEAPSSDPLDEFRSENGRSYDGGSSSQENPWGFAEEEPADIPLTRTRRADQVADSRPSGRPSWRFFAATGAARRWPYAVFLAMTITAAVAAWSVGAWQRKSAKFSAPADSPAAASTSQAPVPPRTPPASVPDAVSSPPVTAHRGETPNRPASTATQPRGELSGLWVLTNRIEQSNVAGYRNLTLSFRVRLNQDGNQLSGQGHKWEENGRRVSSRGQTPIAIAGTIEGNEVVLSFTERGTRRTSHGRLELRRISGGVLDGRFSSGAARSSGHARAVRVSSVHAFEQHDVARHRAAHDRELRAVRRPLEVDDVAAGVLRQHSRLAAVDRLDPDASPGRMSVRKAAPVGRPHQ